MLVWSSALPCRCIAAAAVVAQPGHQCCANGGGQRHDRPVSTPESSHQQCSHCTTAIASATNPAVATDAQSQWTAAVAVVAAPLDTPIAGGVARSHDPPGFVSLRLFAILCTLIL